MRRYFLGSWLPAQQFFDKFIDNTIALSSSGIRIVSAIRIQGIALYEFIWPAVLSHDYSYAAILPVKSIFDIVAWSVAVIFVAIPFIFAKIFPSNRRKILLLVLLYIVSIVPAGNFIVPAGTIYAERLQYIPSIWLAIFAAMIFLRISRKLRHPLASAIIAAVILALSVRTIMRTFDWKNSYTLAESGIKTSPGSLKTWNNYAVQLAEKGELREAIAACDKALAIHSRYATGYANKGLFLAKIGDLKAAEMNLKKALRLNIRHPAAAYNLGVVYINTGRRSQAIAVWRHGIKYNANDANLRGALNSLKALRERNQR
jgi:tetratricopeptide (TPR) repeat protein